LGGYWLLSVSAGTGLGFFEKKFILAWYRICF
jgi:hypothetical protein